MSAPAQEDIDRAADKVMQALFPQARPNEGMTAWDSYPDETKDMARRLVTAVAERLAEEKVAKESTSLWINAFACVAPTEEFAARVGRDLIGLVGVPGKGVVRVSIS